MKKFIANSLAATLILTSVACSSAENEVERSNTSPQMHFVVSIKADAASDRYWAEVEKGALEKAKELGAEVTVLAATGDAKAQITQLEEQIAKGVSGIAVAPIDDAALAPTLKKAQDAQIPLIYIDTQGSLNDVTFIGTNNYEAGKLAGDFLCSPENAFLPKNSEVILLTSEADDPVSKERARGSREVAEACTFKIVAEQAVGWDAEQAKSAMNELLAQFPDIMAVVTVDDSLALGAVEAIAAAGKNEQVTVIGIGTRPESIAAIDAGNMNATLALNPYNIGAWGVDNLYKLASQEPIPPSIDTGTMLVTKDNIEQFK